MMISIIKKYIIVAMLCLVSAYIGFYYSRYTSSEFFVISNIDSQLYDINAALDLLEYADENYTNDNKLKDGVKYIILKNMANISMIRPRLNDLKGVPISVLKKVIDYNSSKGMALSDTDGSFSFVFDYLVEVEPDVNMLVNERKSVLKKPFKNRK